MVFFTLFAVVEQIFGNLFAVLAVVGSFFMLITTFSDSTSSVYDQFHRWGIGGFTIGLLGRFSMMITGTTAEKIGIIYPLATEYINGLLLLSLGFMILRVWLRSKRYQFM